MIQTESFSSKPKQSKTQQRGILELDRFRVPFRIYGDHQPTLILLNGAQQSMGVWRAFIPQFIKNYRIITFDFPGQGRAEILSGSSVVLYDEQIEVLHKVILALSSNQPTYLFGASWGSIIAATLASRYPKLIHKMILASFGIKTNKFILELMRKGRELFDKGDFESIGPLLIEGFAGNIPEALKEAIRKQFQNINIEHLKTFYAHTQFVESIKNIMDFFDVKKIKAETLLINGENDTIIDIADNQHFADEMPNCKYIVVKNAGHFLHFEDPKVFDIYKEFLAN